MPDKLIQELRAASGAADTVAISIRSPADDQVIDYPLKRSFAVIGQGTRCDIKLLDPSIAYRHVYLQVVNGHVYCVDLVGEEGIRWNEGVVGSGWLTVGRTAEIGPYTLSLADGHGSEHEPILDDFDPLSQYSSQLDALPHVEVEFLDGTDNPPIRTLRNVITLVGKSRRCRFELKADSVSEIHCALVLTLDGLWVVDLLGRSGTKVNRVPVRFARLGGGKQLTVGSFRMRVHYGRKSVRAASPGSTYISMTPQGEEEESKLEHEAATPSATGAVVDTTGVNKVLKIARHNAVFILTPEGDPNKMRYADIHQEGNRVLQLINQGDFGNLVLDLAGFDYSGAEFIGALVRIARAATNKGYVVAFCNTSEKMDSVFRNMSLDKLWPFFPSRDEAIDSFNDVDQS